MFWKREKIPVILPDELKSAIEEQRAQLIVDVRSKEDFKAAHIPSAINIPLEELEQRNAELDPAKPTVFY